MGIQGVFLTFLFGFLFVLFEKPFKSFFEQIVDRFIFFNRKDFAGSGAVKTISVVSPGAASGVLRMMPG